MTDDLLTSDEVRAILRVERTALARYLVGPDRIPHLRLGNPRTGPLRIRRSALEEWIRRREEETGGSEDIRAVSAVLGHASVSITVDLYGAEADEARRKAAAAVDGVLGMRAK